MERDEKQKAHAYVLNLIKTSPLEVSKQISARLENGESILKIYGEYLYKEMDQSIENTSEQEIPSKVLSDDETTNIVNPVKVIKAHTTITHFPRRYDKGKHHGKKF